jgi:site-specific DNA-methyltransferase (adenine-specific)
MKLIDKESIDMILCDLPYGSTKNPWDLIIPFEDLWGQYTRIIKKNGAIVLFGQGLFSSQLMMSNKKLWRYNLIWEKDRPSGFLNAAKMPLRSHEDILVFYKAAPIYNPQFWEGIPLHGMGTKYKEGHLANNNYGEFASHTNPSAERTGDTKKYPRSVLKFAKPHPPIHPTQKPIELCEWLIKTYTNEEQLVLDNCCGSATTCLAAKNLNRNFIGFETDINYFDIAKKRLGL